MSVEMTETLLEERSGEGSSGQEDALGLAIRSEMVLGSVREKAVKSLSGVFSSISLFLCEAETPWRH